MPRTLPLVLLVLFLGGTARRAGAGGPSTLNEVDRRALAWVEGLGRPSVAGRPYVRITSTSKPDALRPWSHVVEGVLLAESEAGWIVLTPTLRTERPRRLDSAWDVRRETLDLETVAREERARLSSPARGLVLAAFCAANGLEAAAGDLLAAARRLPLPEGEAIERPLEERVADGLDVRVIWEITLDFDDLSVPRTRLLAQLEAFLASFPKSKHRPTAEEGGRILARMVAEDAAHPALTPEALAALPVDARIQELIFRLRDQHGAQFSQPGSPSIFRFDDEDAASPAQALQDLGMVAVPALIEALDDHRFTRTVGYWRDFTYSHYVVRIGDAALELLGRSTGQSFFHGTYTAASMIKDGEGKAVQARYRAWWAEVSGFAAPLQALAAATDPVRRAELARALPDRGPGAILGAPADARWGTGMVQAACPGMSGAATCLWLRAVVAESPHPRTKALAAWALRDKGDATAVPSVIALWRNLSAEQRSDPVQGGAVASFLASCGDVDAVRALFEGLDSRPPAVRELVVLAFSRGGLGAVRGLAADGSGGGIEERWKPSAEVSRAVEDGIAARLSDLEPDPLGVRRRQSPLADLDTQFDAGGRTADLAIEVLALRWPDAYPLPFVPVRPADDWEALRTGFLVTWRTRRASPPPR